MKVGMSSLSQYLRKLVQAANAARGERDWAMAARIGRHDGQGVAGQRRIGAKALRSAGDGARDARRWTEAARIYQAYLRDVPDDVAIWAQLGHCLKEGGDLEAGEAAYRKGLEKDPENADLYLHLGHVLKLERQIEASAAAYRRSFELLPLRAAYDELAALDIALPEALLEKASDRGAPDLLYFEIDDLLNYARDYTTLSGIQRVQVGIIEQVMGRLAANPTGYAFVFGSAGRDGFWRAEPAHLKLLIDYLTGDTVTRERLRDLIRHLENHAVLVRPAAGQCYFVLGAFWAFSGDAARYPRLKAAGVVTGACVYDLIPLTHPEFCSGQLVNDFTLAIGDGFAVFDFVITISQFTAQEVRRFQEKHDLRRVPVVPVPLAHLLHENMPEPAPWSGAIAALRDRPFVLSVSTLEPRKNHAYLVTIWKLFLEEGLDPPDLVLVGKYGWNIADFREQLESARYLGGRVHILHGLTDAQLERLYQSCLFTAFPSIVEGWGLPVGESLAHGRACIASDASSIPEVGGDLVDYIDPYNLRAGIDVFRRMAFDADYRARREKAVRDGFVVRTWREVGDDLLCSIARLRRVEVDRQVAPLLLPGEMFVPAELRLAHTAPPNYPARPLRPIMAEGWYRAEASGAWMRGGEGTLRFRTGLPAATEVVVYLCLVGASWSKDQTIDIDIGNTTDIGGVKQPANDGVGSLDAEPSTSRQFPAKASSRLGRFPIKANRLLLCHAPGRVAADGVIEVRLRVNGTSQIPRTENRLFWVGLGCLAYAEAADIALRTAILESIALGEAGHAAVETKKPTSGRSDVSSHKTEPDHSNDGPSDETAQAKVDRKPIVHARASGD
jgi:glycosyltransferase involved in cell wall biosynthesis